MTPLTESEKVIAFEVVDIKTNEVIHTENVSGLIGSDVDRCEMGLLSKVDLDRFFVREVKKP